MKSLQEYLKGSIRLRLGLGLGLMLAPLAALGVSSYLSSRSIVRGLEDLVRTEQEALQPVMRLQNLVLQAAMPPNDFLILGSASERVLFTQLQHEVDVVFASIKQSRVMDLARTRSLVLESLEAWLKAQSHGLLLFSVEKPVGNHEAGAHMKVFDQHIGRTVSALDQLSLAISQDIKHFESEAHRVQRNAMLFLAVIFLLALLSMLITSYLLSRSITTPIQVLEEGMLRFSQGDHSFRVDLERVDEFGHLARTLNVMAAKIECDGLTGMLTRQEFERRLKGEVDRSQRYGLVFSVLMLDLDHFKKVNDQYGHQAGDDVLRTITRRLADDFRAADCLARYGGEEFVAMLPETDSRGAQVIAGRLCMLVASAPVVTTTGAEIPVTISIGAATFPGDGAAGEALVAAADTALYAAKRGGRNRAVAYEPALDPALGE